MFDLHKKEKDIQKVEELLKFFLFKKDYSLGEVISKRVSFPIDKLDFLINKLQKQGYDISFNPHLGFRLESIPDKLDVGLIRAGLDTKKIGKEIYVFDTINSTNDAIFNIALKGAKEGSVVIAARQTKGRGRQGRTWISPKGGIYLSILLVPDIDFERITIFNIIGALAVAETLNKFFNIDVSIKWPNDVYLKDKKLCGVLAEIKKIHKKKDVLILGIGININSSLDMLPEQSASLKVCMNRQVNKVLILWEVLKQIETYYNLYKNREFSYILGKWKSYSFMLGHQIEITEGKSVLEGYVINIDPSNGNLIIRLDSGLEKVVTGGCMKILK